MAGPAHLSYKIRDRSTPDELVEHHIGMAVQNLNLAVRGMTCANCARSVESHLASIPGVTKAKVDLQAAEAQIEFDSELVKPEVVANAVRQLGYEVAA